MKTDRQEYAGEAFKALFLREGRFTSKEFRDCAFDGCDFTRAEFSLCRFENCSFRGCNLSLARLGSSVFTGTAFKDSKLVGVNWTEAHWPRIRLAAPVSFDNCLMNDSVFLGLALPKTRFSGCQARGADFRDADLAGADLRRADLSGALFGGTNLEGADFAGARGYSLNPGDNRLKGARFSLPEAVALLRGLGIKLE